MKCLCIKTDPLQTLEVGKEYDYYKRYNKVHILGVGLVVSEDIFNKHFETMMILTLPLKKEWYNMIEIGTKTEEYRDVKPYWEKRLLDYAAIKANMTEIFLRKRLLGIQTDVCKHFPRGFTHVRFCYGYTKRTITREIESITIGYGKPEWGAPTDKQVFIIKFKKGGEQ